MVGIEARGGPDAVAALEAYFASRTRIEGATRCLERHGVGLGLAMVLALALLAGCAGAGANKAGGQGPRKTVVLTLANFFPDAQEVDGFAANVARLSHGSLRIDVESGWRLGRSRTRTD